ncbi:MAG: 4Fe-4S binding protein, partial [Desulfobacterales bacterium]
MDMRVVRRICQVFFLALFLWLCAVMTLGTGWRQLRGWPVNWFLQIDPLVGLGTLLSTGRLYAGMLWSLAVVCMTLAFGRFFCGWVCPLGTCQ